MAFNIGSSPATKAYAGASPVTKIYNGSTLVWSSEAITDFLFYGGASITGTFLYKSSKSTLAISATGEANAYATNGIYKIAIDNDFVFVRSSNNYIIIKYNRSTLAYIAYLSCSGYTMITDIITDSNYLYVLGYQDYSGGSSPVLKAYNKSTLAFVREYYTGVSSDYYNVSSRLSQDTSYLYLGLELTEFEGVYVFAFLKSQSYPQEYQIAYTYEDIYMSDCLVTDTNAFYVQTYDQTYWDTTIRKYSRSAYYITYSCNLGGSYATKMLQDSSYLYISLSSGLIKKVLKSDMSIVATSASYGGFIADMAMDDTYLYAVGYTTQTVRRYLKSTLAYVSQGAAYGSNLYAIEMDNNMI